MPTRSNWARLGPIILVGHRGAGKSTLGARAAAELDRPFVDLDEEIVDATEHSIRELLADEPARFRALERQRLEHLCETVPPPIIACGAGAHISPTDGFVVWIDRPDWRAEVSDSNRPRVRPELSEQREWEWMEKTRPPRWREASDLRLVVPRGRSVNRCATTLATLLSWVAMLDANDIAQKTWIVPTRCDEFERAAKDSARLGIAGIEYRSDVFESPPGAVSEIAHIASLRHDQPQWLDQFPDASRWDIDRQYISSALKATLSHRPPTLMLSAHPEHPSMAHVDELERAATEIADKFSLNLSSVELKYVPHIASFDDLDKLLDIRDRLLERGQPHTILPGGRHFAWSRPIFANDNVSNYLPIGISARHPEHPSALDLQQFLPYLAGPAPTHFDALIGDPVAPSQGAFWHRKRDLEDGDEHRSYLKIIVPRQHLERALETVERLPIRGLSVTSPLKREAATCPRIDCPKQLKALNTLRRNRAGDKPWRGIDTDEEGMKACLRWFEQRGVGPGRAIIFGRGGASHAVGRGLLKRNWSIVESVSARRGWRPEHTALDSIDLIVHGAGPDVGRSDNTPTTRAWLDLHYRRVGAPPPNTLHLQGDLFFDGQARAQRRFWSLDDH